MLAVFDKGPPPPCPDPFNLAHYVLEAGQSQPDKIALAVIGASGAEPISYAELTRAVAGTAAGLKALLPETGARVLLRLGNTADFPVAFLGAIAAGLIPVPTSSQLTAAEITGMAAQVEPALIIAAAGIPLSAGAAPVIGTDTLRAMRSLTGGSFDMGPPDRPAYMIFTSGTAGTARAVVHAHRAVWARRMMWQDWYGLGQGDRLLHAGAFNWTYTLGTGLMDPWAAGATALIPGPGVTPDQLPLLLKRHDASIFAAAPGVFRQMLGTDFPAMPKLRHGLSAGEKLPETLHAGWIEKTGLALYEAFGMSEISTFISAGPERPAPPDTLGFPQAGRRIAIVGPDGPVQTGAAGQIAVSRRDPGLMLGYHGAAEETAQRFQGEWFLTGDTAAMNEDGSITYLGRDDDMMNAGGYRVSPIEVETAMATHPAIRECAAVEYEVRPDVKVIALFYAGAETGSDDLQSHAAAALARYKQPRLFFHIGEVPRGANNKVIRRALRHGGGHDLGGA